MLAEELQRVRKIARGTVDNRLAEALQDLNGKLEKIEARLTALEKANTAKSVPKEAKK